MQVAVAAQLSRGHAARTLRNSTRRPLWSNALTGAKLGLSAGADEEGCSPGAGADAAGRSSCAEVSNGSGTASSTAAAARPSFLLTFGMLGAALCARGRWRSAFTGSLLWRRRLVALGQELWPLTKSSAKALPTQDSCRTQYSAAEARALPAAQPPLSRMEDRAASRAWTKPHSGPVLSSPWPQGTGSLSRRLGFLLLAGMDFAALTEGVAALPPAALYLVGTVVFLLAVAALRVISNQLNAKAPPVFEGIPFVGGIIKFVQARARLRDCQGCCLMPNLAL